MSSRLHEKLRAIEERDERLRSENEALQRVVLRQWSRRYRIVVALLLATVSPIVAYVSSAARTEARVGHVVDARSQEHWQKVVGESAHVIDCQAHKRNLEADSLKCERDLREAACSCLPGDPTCVCY